MIQTLEKVRIDFFEEVVTTSEWYLVNIGFLSENQILVNTGDYNIKFSYDGEEVHGILGAGASVTFDNRRRNKLWFRNGNGSSTVYLFAWRNP